MRVCALALALLAAAFSNAPAAEVLAEVWPEVPAVATDYRQLKREYPLALIDRPLLLPRFMSEPSAEIAMTNFSGGSSAGAVALGFDIGLSRRYALGLLIDVPFYPNANFGEAVLNSEIRLNRFLNLRIDVGVQHPFRTSTVFDNQSSWGAILGLGLPFKLKLHRMFALVSGSSDARGFGPSLFLASARQKVYTTGYLMTNDLIAVAVQTDGTVAGAFSIPVGVLFAPHPRFSLTLRSGYRLSFLSGGRAPVHYVPIALDAQVTVVRSFDVGVSAVLPGIVDGTLNGAEGYADLRIFTLWMQGRF